MRYILTDHHQVSRAKTYYGIAHKPCTGSLNNLQNLNLGMKLKRIGEVLKPHVINIKRMVDVSFYFLEHREHVKIVLFFDKLFSFKK